VLVASPFSGVVSQVNNSAVLRTVDRLMPSTARSMFSDFRRLLASGPFPEVFSGIGAAHALSVAPGDPAVLNSLGYQDATTRVFKVKGTAPSCSRVIEGSGFVYSPHHIITNAHVVAGVTQGLQVYSKTGQAYQASVVFYDPQVDVAVLYVPQLNLAPLSFAGQAQIGTNAVVAGYPLDHNFTQVAARIGGMQDATGPDIYQTSQVTRQIYEIKANVEPGNSGGPLISSNGTVYGVVFAAAVGVSDTGFVLTSAEVAVDAHAGRASTVPVSTEGCD
jgi:S1-C subfamily serine protease